MPDPQEVADQLESAAEAIDELVRDSLRAALDAEDPGSGEGERRVLERSRRSVVKAIALLRSLPDGDG